MELRDLELLRWFSYDIQDGHHCSHLESHICSRMISLSLHLMGGIGCYGDSELLKMFWLPPWKPSWNSPNHIFSLTVGQIEPKLDGKHRWKHENSELLDRSVPISKMVAMVTILKLFKQHQILDCWRQSYLVAKVATIAQCNISWSG